MPRKKPARKEHQIAHSRQFKQKCREMGERVRQQRTVRGLTLAEVGAECECSLKTIHRTESGHPPSLAVYWRLCKALNDGRSLMGDCA